MQRITLDDGFVTANTILSGNTTHISPLVPGVTAPKMKFSISDFFSKYDQIRRKLRLWSHY